MAASRAASLGPTSRSSCRARHGSLLGKVGTTLAYWPTSWLGIEAGYGWRGPRGPETFAQRLEFEWAIGSVGQGLGVGIAESYVRRGPDGAPLAQPGFLQFLDSDVSHFTVYFNRSVSLRATLGMAFPIRGGAICGEDEWSGSVCGGMVLSGTGTLFWSFDLGSGER